MHMRLYGAWTVQAYDKALEALFVNSQPFLCPTYTNRRRKRRSI